MRSRRQQRFGPHDEERCIANACYYRAGICDPCGRGTPLQKASLMEPGGERPEVEDLV